MNRNRTYKRRLLTFCLGVLFLGQQLLVSLHFILVDHLHHPQSNVTHYSTELGHSCQVAKFFSLNLLLFKVCLNAEYVEYKENLQLPKLCIRHTKIKIENTNRGPPTDLMAYT